MSLIVPSIVGGVSEHNRIVNKCADNWTAESLLVMRQCKLTSKDTHISGTKNA